MMGESHKQARARNIRRASYQARYWKRRILSEQRRESNDMHGLAPPGAGWKIRAYRRFDVASRTYSRGCEVPLEAIPADGERRRALFAPRHGEPTLQWVPPGTVFAVQPIERPPAEPQPPRPVAEIVADPDAPTSWFTSLQRLVDLGVPRATAQDMLLGLPNGGDLYRDAIRIAVAREKEKRGLGTYQSLTPNHCGF
jgi:hypothetical protein